MFVSLFLALYDIREINGDDDEVVLFAITGFLTAVRWMLLLFVPLIQVTAELIELHSTVVAIFTILHYFQGCSSNLFW